MLGRNQPLAFLLDGYTGRPECKMALGMLRYSPNPVVCAVDEETAGRRLSEFFELPRDCPIVASAEEARDAGATVLVIGTAPSGGRIPERYYGHLDRAVRAGLSIVNGLHDRLASRYPGLAPGQWIWDIRIEPKGIGVAAGRAALLPNRRLLTIGTDMAIGKMTAGLEILREAQSRGVDAEFVATGQIGIAIRGGGIPLDAIKVDYACGAVEQAVLAAGRAELIIVEGQGSLVHPGSTATLPLLRGTCPTDLLLCHRAGQTHLVKVPGVRIPPLPDLIRLYEDLAATCGAFPRPRTAGIALNTAHLEAPEARRAKDELARETALPVTDVLRDGAAPLVDALRLR
jgi:uncharacterized NAD-dependent epimerase/dehydratase family protein